MGEPKLYIIMRNDLDSLNPGKAMAQAAHAANMFTKHRDWPDAKKISAYIQWLNQADGFGTTIVLSGNLKQIRNLFFISQEENYVSGMVLDPDYPVKDGETTHHVSLMTCGYVFIQGTEGADKTQSLIRKLDLQ